MPARPRLGLVQALPLLVAACAGRPSAPTAPRASVPEPDRLRPKLEAALVFAEAQLANFFTRVPEEDVLVEQTYPQHTEAGSFVLTNSRHWTAGFFPSLLWAYYGLGGQDHWKRRAEVKTLGLWGEAVWEKAENLGYKMLPFREGYTLSGDEAWLRFFLKGAATYAQRFGSPACIRSIPTWVPGTRKEGGATLLHGVHVSSLVNAELLFWAARQRGGDRAWHQLALEHALNAARDHLRPDGSAYTIVDYWPGCPERGFRWRGTDGRTDERTRARSQAYAVYGFALAFRYTGESALLAAATRAAEYYLGAPTLPADGVPYWDLSFGPQSSETRDTSAAALVTMGLFELGDLAQLGPAARARYRAAGERILESLVTRYLAHGQREGILKDVFYTVREGNLPVTSMAMADYYLLKAIARYLRSAGVICAGLTCELEAESAVRLDPPLAREDGPPAHITAAGPGGRAEYRFDTARAGRYAVRMVLDAPATSPRSLRVDLDRPGSGKVWDIPRTSGFEVRTVAFQDESLWMERGAHTLVVTGATPGLAIDRIVLDRRTRIREEFSGAEARGLVAAAGRWQIDGGAYELVEPGPAGAAPLASHAVHETWVRDPFAFRAKVRVIGAAGQAVLIFGMKDAANHYFVSFGDAKGDGLYRVSSGTVTRLAAITTPIDTDRWYAVEVDRRGDRIEIRRNGLPVATAEDATFSGGRVGFGAHGRRAMFDDLVVE